MGLLGLPTNTNTNISLHTHTGSQMMAQEQDGHPSGAQLPPPPLSVHSSSVPTAASPQPPPRKPPEPESETLASLPLPPPRLLRILFVDTYVARASEVRRVLEHEVRGGLWPELVAAFDVVRDGLEALALAQVVPYDAILLSAGLRDITAEELVSDLLHIGLRVPLILMAGPNTVDTEKAAARGFNAILLRPVTGAGLAGVLRALCLPPPPSTSPPHAPTEATAQRTTHTSFSSSSSAAATARKRPTLSAPQELPEWADVVSGRASIDEDDDNSNRKPTGNASSSSSSSSSSPPSSSSTPCWRPPQILRMPISQTLSHLRLQPQSTPKRPPPVPRGWCVKKRAATKKKEAVVGVGEGGLKDDRVPPSSQVSRKKRK